MEDLSDLGGRGHPGAARPTPGASLPSSSKVSVQVYTVPTSASGGGARAHVVAPAMLHESSAGFLIPVGKKNRNPPIKPIYREYRDFLFLFLFFLFFIYFLIYFLV